MIDCAGIDFKIRPIRPSPNKKYKAIKTKKTPKHCFSTSLLIERIYWVAKKEKSTLKKVTIPIRLQRMYFQLRIAIIKAVLPANNPESITDSPYEGNRKGKNIITKIPKPKPLTLWMKLAIIERNKIKKQVIIVNYNIMCHSKQSEESDDIILYNQILHYAQDDT